ncbi:hypothetical protein B1P86_07735 [Enterococcus faecium]|nr:hypothetical protein B1P86_07735 [Enterococcus faecium]
MTYTHLTPNELVMIEAYFHQETPVAIVAKQLKRGRQFILQKDNTQLSKYVLEVGTNELITFNTLFYSK